MLDRRLVKLGGLEKDWPIVSGFTGFSGREVVDAALFITKAPEVFTARFLRFLPFLPGVVDLCSSKNGCEECIIALSEVCGRICVVPNEVGYGFPNGDSGEDPGDISVAEESSTIDAVVVGDESAEVEAEVETLSLC